MSNSRKEGFKKGTIECYQNKPIWQFDLNGVFIKKYDNIKNAALDNNISRSSIMRYLKGIYRKGGNFLWSLDGSNPKPYKYYKIKTGLERSLKVTDLDGNSMIFKSFKDTAKFFNVSSPVISVVVKNGNLYKQKYKIEYEDCRITK